MQQVKSLKQVAVMGLGAMLLTSSIALTGCTNPFAPKEDPANQQASQGQVQPGAEQGNQSINSGQAPAQIPSDGVPVDANGNPMGGQVEQQQAQPNQKEVVMQPDGTIVTTNPSTGSTTIQPGAQGQSQAASEHGAAQQAQSTGAPAEQAQPQGQSQAAPTGGNSMSNVGTGK